ncbi:hypothetical protein D9M68_847520 [compost metagenome]
MLLTGFVTGAVGHADEQPLVLERRQRYRMPLRIDTGEPRQGALRLDQLAVVAATFRTDHVIGDIRGDHRRCAHEQQEQHLPATRARAGGGLGARLVQLGQAVHGQHQRFIGLLGHGGCAFGGGK